MLDLGFLISDLGFGIVVVSVLYVEGQSRPVGF